jgi:hypothetical protein
MLCSNISQSRWLLRCRLAAAAGYKQGEVLPRRLVCPGCHAPVDGPQDGAELAVVDANDDDQSSVRSDGLGPAASDIGEVRDIEGHHDSVLARSHFQQGLVSGAVELTLLIGGADVVVASAQSLGDATPGNVGVEEKAHRSVPGQISITSTPG